MRRFLSVCSGIEAASVAFQPLGWESVAFAEIEPFPCQILAHHYPQVPNLGDLTRFRDWPAELLEQADILCGGTPCQAFSVAGLRGSLDDERGNLTLTFVHLYDRIDHIRKLAGRPPAVCIWENVPGIFSDKQNAFGCFLAGLVGEAVPLQPAGGRWTHAGAVCGPQRTAAWRVIDAQYHGLAQRRQRVVVVASADPAFDPAAVLFEWDGLRRDTPPSREPGQSTAPDVAPCLTSGGRSPERTGDTRGQDCVIAEPLTTRPYADNASQEGRLIPEVCPTLLGGGNTTGVHRPPGSTVDNCESLIPTLANCLTRRMAKGLNTTLDEGQTTIGEGFAASEDGTGRGTPLVPVALPSCTGPLCSNGKAAYSATQQDAEQGMLIPHIMPTLRAGAANGGKGHGALAGSKDDYIIPQILPFDTPQITSAANRSAPKAGDPGHPLAAGAHAPAIAFAIQERACCENPAAGPDGQVAQAVAFQPRIARNGRGDTGDIINALNAQRGQTGKGDSSPCVAFTLHGTREGTREVATQTDVAGTIREGTGSAIQNSSNTLVQNWAVRRLTCEECELLQGFPIGYTLLPGKGKRKGEDLQQTTDYLIALGFPAAEAAVLAHCPDGPRYKALGNSWAVPVFTWVGTRVERMLNHEPLS